MRAANAPGSTAFSPAIVIDDHPQTKATRPTVRIFRIGFSRLLWHLKMIPGLFENLNSNRVQ
jgi:hypothetical protein